MSKTDFQNGFVVGFSAKGVPEISVNTTEEINDESTHNEIPTAKAVVDYINNNVETIDVWSYSKANLGDKRLNSLPTNMDRVLMITADKAFNSKTNEYFLEAELCLYVAEYYNREIHSIDGVKHPFTVKLNPDTDFYAVYGRQNIVDVAVMLGDTDNIITFTSIIKDLVDGTTFTSGELETFSYRGGNNSSYPLSIGMKMKIYSPYEQAIDGLITEFNNYMAYATHALIYYKNTPLNLVEGG